MTVLIPGITASSIYKTQEEKEEQARKQLEHYRNSLAHILRGYARTLMGSERLQVKFVANLPAAARLVEGSVVEINADDFTGIEDLTDVACTYGTVLHELGHFEYSPTQYDPLTQWVISNGVFSAFNLLEDMRLETRLATRWPTVASWFDVVIAKHVLDGGINETAWLFLAGRETSARGLRVAALKKFKGDARAAFDLAVEYNRIVPAKDSDRAKEIIAAFAHLMREATKQPEGGTKEPEGPYGEPVGPGPFKGEKPTHNTPKTEEEQEGETLPPTNWDYSDEEQEDSDSPDGEDTSDPGDGEGDSESTGGSSGSDGDGSDDDDDDFGDLPEESGVSQGDDFDTPSRAEKESNERSHQTATDEGSSGVGDATSDTAKDLVEAALEQALGEVRERVESDLKRLKDADLDRDVISRFEGSTEQIPVEFQALASSFERELKVLRGLAAPGFDDRKRSGRLNVRRYVATREQPRRVFDRFNPGSREAVSLHLDILIDQSGSMGDQGPRAYFMAWAIKRALDALGTATSSIISYDYVAKTVYNPDQRVPLTETVNSYTGGGTNVQPALAQALRHCHRSNARYKAVFLLTDGAFANEEGEDEIRRLHEKGVYTSLFYLSPYGYTSDNAHGMQSLVNVSDAADLVAHIRGVVVEDIKKNIVSR